MHCSLAAWMTPCGLQDCHTITLHGLAHPYLVDDCKLVGNDARPGRPLRSSHCCSWQMRCQEQRCSWGQIICSCRPTNLELVAAHRRRLRSFQATTDGACVSLIRRFVNSGFLAPVWYWRHKEREIGYILLLLFSARQHRCSISCQSSGWVSRLHPSSFRHWLCATMAISYAVSRRYCNN